MPGNSRKNINARAKRFENSFAQFLTDNGIPAERVDRGRDYGRSDTDVKVIGHPRLQIDCKTKEAFAHHTQFEQEVIDKYVKKKGDIPIMPTKKEGQRGCYVVITDTFFVELLKLYLTQGNKPTSKEEQAVINRSADEVECAVEYLEKLNTSIADEVTRIKGVLNGIR